MRRPDRSLPAALLLGAICLAGPASAQDRNYRLSFVAGVLVTDNVRNVAMPASDDQQGPEAGAILEMTPSFLLSYETPRWLHEIQYLFNLSTTLGGDSLYNYTNRLELRNRHDVSERTVLNLMLRASQGQQTLFPNSATGTPTTFILQGGYTYAGVESTEGIGHAITEDLSFSQSLGVSGFFPIEVETPRSTVLSVTSQLGLTYRDGPDSYGIALSNQVIAARECESDAQCGADRTCDLTTHQCLLTCSDDGGCTTGSVCDPATNRCVPTTTINQDDPQLTNRLTISQQHDFNNGFLSQIEVGVQQIMNLRSGGDQFWQPTGRGTLRYDREEATVALSANHGGQLNIDLGQFILTDNVDLTGAIPLDRQTRRLVLAAQLAYQRGTPIVTDSSQGAAFNIFAADAALVFRPERWLPNFEASLRYQLRYQITEGFLPGSDPSTAIAESHTLRNAVSLNVGFDYPERKPQQ